MKDNLYLKPLKEIDQLLWQEYWKERTTAAGAPQNFEKYKNENWTEKLQQLKLEEEHGVEPYGLKIIQYVLICNDKIIGNGSIFLNPEVVPEKEYMNHIGCGLSPLYRGKGYGTEMLHLFIEECSKLGFKEVVVTCDKDNIASSKMIEKSGGQLQEIGIYEGMNPDKQNKEQKKYIIDVEKSLEQYKKDSDMSIQNKTL